jgi:hypothetical protein
MSITELKEGDVVVSLRHLEAGSANVRPGTIGVVHNNDRLVFWMTGGACKVCDSDVEKKGKVGQKLDVLAGMVI